MKEITLQGKINSAAKWSSLTEIIAKLIVPLTNMILARILLPEAFGILATVILVISFAEVFADAGFQKYLIQKDFESLEEKYVYANVAFWTNLILAFFLWSLLLIFNDEIATMVGNPNIGNVIAVAGVQLIFIAFSSIQMALYKRDFDFKTLFLVRVFTISIPFIITIPLAFLGLSYWALVIGTIATQILNAIILTIKSSWKPKFNYDFSVLKKMFSFSVWSLLEAISIWLTVWIDALIIAVILNEYYLGLFKTSTTMVNSLLAIVTAAVVPVLFSALSRLQNNENEFNDLFFSTQRFISIFIFPLGVGVFVFSDFATRILLGSGWEEASGIMGMWALTSSISIVFGHFCSEVYRAKGRPGLSFLAQIIHLIILIPTILISVKFGFWVLVIARSWIRLQLVATHFIIMKFIIGIPLFRTLKNVLPAAFAATFMGISGYFLRNINSSILWDLTVIIICILIYFTVLLSFPTQRTIILDVIKSLNFKVKHKLINKF